MLQPGISGAATLDLVAAVLDLVAAVLDLVAAVLDLVLQSWISCCSLGSRAAVLILVLQWCI